jgi:hypothetical protein
MSDQQQQIEMSFEEVLINRMAQRMGAAAAQIEALQLQLELAQQRIAELEQRPAPPMMAQTMNGEHEEWPQSAPI